MTLLMISACKENEEYEEYEEFQIPVNTKKENLRKNIYRGEREVQIASDGERCALVFEWHEDMRVCNLDRCWLRMLSRDKLAWRNRMLKTLKQ